MTTERRRYGVWAGHTNGVPEDMTRCREAVPGAARGMINKQCSKPRGYGADAAYCKIHAKRHPEAS